MKYIAACTLVLILPFSVALAQTYVDSSGTVVPGVAPIPFPFTPLAPGQHNLAPTGATGLAVPAGARYATVCGSTATIRFTTDGTTPPTNTVGMPLAAGACVTLSGSAVLANFKAISASGTLDVEYFK